MKLAFQFVLFLMTIVLFTIDSPAEKMTYENHSLVISKLETALKLMGKNEASKGPTLKRLADLYSDRARLAEMKEIEANCKGCKGSKSDRLQAIRNYEKAVQHGIDNSTIISQLAHLFTLTGQSHKSKAIYDRIIKKSTKTYNAKLVGEAHLSKAYLQYKAKKSKKALYHFQQTLKYPVDQPTSVTLFYVAWCKFNLGQESEARGLMEKSLRQAQAQVKTTPSLNEFLQEASRDLGVFYARTELTNKRIDNLLGLTPVSVRISNFKTLADELERLGKHKSTAKIWGLIAKVSKDPNALLEAKFKFAKNSYNIGKLATAQTQFTEVTQGWRAKPCRTDNDVDCEALKTEMRNFILVWNNTEKSKPSAHLVKSYHSYNTLFFQDNEMLQWGAQAATLIGNHTLAKQFFRQITLNNFKKGNIENSLMAEVESAENSNDLNSKIDSYLNYMKVNPKGKNLDKVRYQLAQSYYEQKRYRASETIFCNLAERSKNKKVNLPSAHLCLDTRALLGQSLKVEKTALTFSKMYPSDRLEFLKIARNAGLTYVAASTGKSKSLRTQRDGLNRLNKMNLAGASTADRHKVYKNKVILSEGINDINSALGATNSILGLKDISEAQRDWAIDKKIWFSELIFNFGTAYSLYKTKHPIKNASKNQLIKLSVLSELAGKNSTKYDTKLLTKTRGVHKKNEIRAKMILKSRSPWTEFFKNEKQLKKSRALYTDLALEIYAKYKNQGRLKKVLKNKFVRNYASGQRLHRILNLAEINTLKKQVNAHKISTTNNARLEKTLKRRLTLIENIEKKVVQYSKQMDWISQAIAFEVIANQYQRVYDRILTFPAPRGISPQELQQFKVLLGQQAIPYKNKSKVAYNKADQFWNNSKLFSSLTEQNNAASFSLQKVIAREITEVSRFAPSKQRRILRKALSFKYPNRNEMTKVYAEIKKNPFSQPKLLKALGLEKIRDQKTMSTYLAERIKTNKKRRVN